jgi:hypothetical protein
MIFILLWRPLSASSTGGALRPTPHKDGIVEGEAEPIPPVPRYIYHHHIFDPPKTGKIAVKVINHYGNEVLMAYEV